MYFLHPHSPPPLRRRCATCFYSRYSRFSRPHCTATVRLSELRVPLRYQRYDRFSQPRAAHDRRNAEEAPMALVGEGNVGPHKIVGRQFRRTSHPKAQRKRVPKHSCAVNCSRNTAHQGPGALKDRKLRQTFR